MSDHTGINHGAILVAFFASGGVGFQTARESSEALVAENQQLRDALDMLLRESFIEARLVNIARAALAGTPGEDA
jgi:hypothetical protein